MINSLLGRRIADCLGLFVCLLFAAACETGIKATSASSGAPGQAGVTFSVNVSRPVGGTIVSLVDGAPDGKIECGTNGGSANDCAEVSYSWSQAVTFTATPDDGFRFAGWAADCLGTLPTCTLDTTERGADKWVAAVFEPEALYPGIWFRVTVERPSNGTVTSHDGRIRCGSAADATLCGPTLFRWNESATLTAAADFGYSFEGWGGDCPGGGVCTLNTVSAATDKTVSATFSLALYSPYGPQTNVPVAALVGWTQCYSDLYANTSMSAASVLAACPGEKLMLACRPLGSSVLRLLAWAPREDVTFPVPPGANQNTPHVANGTGWYFDANYSWGFARAGDPIERDSCDVSGWQVGFTDAASPFRLCWHTHNWNAPGWRCGATAELNFEANWERIVYRAD